MANEKKQGVVDRLATTRHRKGAFTAPALAGLWLFGAACVLHTARVELMWSIVAAAVLIVVSPIATYLHREGHKPSAWYAFVVAAAAGSWLTYSAMTTPSTATVAGGFWWLVLGVLGLGWPYGLLRRKKLAVLAQERVAQQKRMDEWKSGRTENDWRTILTRAGLANVALDGEPVEVRPGVIELSARLPEDGTVSFKKVFDKANQITLAASHVLKSRGIKISTGAVTVMEVKEDASAVKILVRLRDIIKDEVPFPEDHDEPTSILQPLLIGLFENGMKLLLTISGAHGQIIGATGSGKSVVLNCIIAQLLRCIDAVIWVAGADKLWQLVDPWMAPWYRGEMPHPPFDMVAGQRQDEVLRMLKMMFHAITIRQSLPHKNGKLILSKSRPAIVGFLEEAISAYRNNDTIRIHTGEHMTAAQLVSEIKRLGRSERVLLYDLSQASVYSVAGSHGPIMARNTTARICLQTMTEYDGRETLGSGAGAGIDTTKLTDNAMYVKTNTEKAVPAMLGKSFALFDDDEVAELVLRRWRADLFSELDPETARGLGKDYAERWHSDRAHEVYAQRRNFLANENEELVSVAAARGDYDNEAAEGGREHEGGSVVTHHQPSPSDGTMFGPPPALAERMKAALNKHGVPTDEGPAGPGAGGDGGEQAPEPAGAEDPESEQQRFDDAFASITDSLRNEQEMTAAAMGEQPVPEPLSDLLTAFFDDPRDFISSAELGQAVGLDATALGLALSQAVPNLKSKQKRLDTGDGKKKPVRGYYMDRLREAAVAASRGEELPPDAPADSAK